MTSIQSAGASSYVNEIGVSALAVENKPIKVLPVDVFSIIVPQQVPSCFVDPYSVGQEQKSICVAALSEEGESMQFFEVTGKIYQLAHGDESWGRGQYEPIDVNGKEYSSLSPEISSSVLLWKYALSRKRDQPSPLGPFLKVNQGQTLPFFEHLKTMVKSRDTKQPLDKLTENCLADFLTILLENKEGQGAEVLSLLREEPHLFTKNDLLTRWAAQGSKTMMDLIRKLDLKESLTQRLAIQAAENDPEFSIEEFKQLLDEDQLSVFQIANTFMSFEILKKLTEWQEDRFKMLYKKPIGPALFSNFEDAQRVRITLVSFFKTLREQNLLLTDAEFKKLDQSHFFSKDGKAFNKGSIGRILGRNYLERLAKESSFVRVPQKVAVFPADFKFERGSEFTIVLPEQTLEPTCNLRVFAENITPLERKATKKEMEQLFFVIQQSGFNDFAGRNIILGKDSSGREGFYIIDTEYKNFLVDFSQKNWSNLYLFFKDFMAKEDLEWLKDQMRCNNCSGGKLPERSELMSDFAQHAEEIYGKNRVRTFSLSIDEIS